MKIIILIISLGFFITACGEQDKSPSTKSVEPKLSSETETPNPDVQPSADYSSLFNKDPIKCISTQDVAVAINQPIEIIKKVETSGSISCEFDITMADKSVMKYSYIAMAISLAQVEKEITSDLKDKKAGQQILGMDIIRSSTSNNYFSLRPIRSEIVIYNMNYPFAILNNFNLGMQQKLSKDQRKERMDYLLKLVNKLVEIHKR